MELKRILSVPEPQHIFSIMIEEGILDEVFPPIEIEGLSKVESVSFPPESLRSIAARYSQIRFKRKRVRKYSV